MDVRMMMVFTNYGWDDCSDQRVWDEEIRLARIAADSGFDCLWSAEHHFADYSFVPDNLALMTHLTALCPNIDVRSRHRYRTRSQRSAAPLPQRPSSCRGTTRCVSPRTPPYSTS